MLEGRTTKAGHAVERFCGDLVFCNLAVHFPGVDLWADDELAALDLGLDEGAGMSLLEYANRPAETEHGLRMMQDGVEVVNVDVFNKG